MPVLVQIQGRDASAAFRHAAVFSGVSSPLGHTFNVSSVLGLLSSINAWCGCRCILELLPAHRPGFSGHAAAPGAALCLLLLPQTPPCCTLCPPSNATYPTLTWKGHRAGGSEGLGGKGGTSGRQRALLPLSTPQALLQADLKVTFRKLTADSRRQSSGPAEEPFGTDVPQGATRDSSLSAQTERWCQGVSAQGLGTAGSRRGTAPWPTSWAAAGGAGLVLLLALACFRRRSKAQLCVPKAGASSWAAGAYV
ncbi:hypothetical protein Anapl_00922 [Anas platyrhynchos]|uniref:Uncharacterized protein n=1 Tax=Anas platyrhynchos TaxID=8839 RepID=R0LAU1_ANAPL|nr:hypothetical protein Anapl_00922 [Anas platyrhynchos]